MPRQSDPKKFKGNSSFVVRGFKTEKQRIKESLENNKILDPHPITSTFYFRQRDKSKELVFKKKEKKVELKPLNIDVSAKKDNDEDSKTSSSSFSLTYKSTDFFLPVASSKSSKMHFKALTQKIINDYSELQLGKAQNQLALVRNHNSSATLTEKNELKNGMFQQINRPLGLQVLEKCSIILPKRTSQYLKKGFGHLMSNPEVPNSIFVNKFMHK